MYKKSCPDHHSYNPVAPLLEPKLELLIYSVFPPILFCARPWSELKSWCTFQKQLSLCSTVGLVVLAVSPTEALSTSIFSRLLPSKKSGEKKFNSKMYLARAADFNSLWKCPIQLDPFLQEIFCCLCRVHYSTTNKSHRFDFFRISATVIYHKQVPSNYSVIFAKCTCFCMMFIVHLQSLPTSGHHLKYMPSFSFYSNSNSTPPPLPPFGKFMPRF